MTLTKKEKKLYFELLELFNNSGLHKVSTFEAFLELKYESSGCLPAYYNIWQFARNDY